LQIRGLLTDAAVPPAAIRRMALASVVPALTPVFRRFGEEGLGVPTLVIDGDTDTGVMLDVPDPGSVGPDRIVNVVAARFRHGAPAIGGAIAPGIGIAAEALFNRGARLARVEIRAPKQAIGRTTEEHLQSGIFFGTVGQIDEIVRRMAAEMGGKPRVLATGGLVNLVAGYSATIQTIDPDLTLQGIRLVEERQHAPTA
ncbi:MAG: type III pantothenate kinase, partial [bacterium]